MDTLIQISSKYGHGKEQDTGKVVKINNFIGTFDSHLGQVKIEQNPLGWKVIHVYNTTGKQLSQSIYINELLEHDDCIGGGIWLSSIALCSWIMNNKHVFENKRVLELGCGVGLCGLSIATNTSAKTLMFTDNDANVFRCLKQNIERNSKNIHNIPSIQQYDWNCIEPVKGCYDVIVASDCMYHNTKDILLRSIISNLKVNGVLVLSNPPEWSRAGFDMFVYALQEFGNVNIERVKLRMNKHFTKEIWIVVFVRTT